MSRSNTFRVGGFQTCFSLESKILFVCSRVYLCVQQFVCLFKSLFVYPRVYLCVQEFICMFKRLFVFSRVYLWVQVYLCVGRVYLIKRVFEQKGNDKNNSGIISEHLRNILRKISRISKKNC